MTSALHDYSNDASFMRDALAQAQMAADANEVPVGAVIVFDKKIISQGYNCRESRQNPLAHAEIIAIEQAASVSRDWRLTECDMYVTLEPCIMCVGALLQARIRRLIFGCLDPKAGAAESLYRLCADSRLNHRVSVTGGVLGAECATLLEDFFRSLRESKKRTRQAERWPSPVEGA